MAGLEVQIGADNSEFKKKIQEVEQDVAELSKIKLERIKLGLDTKEITANIKDAKKALLDLKTSTKDAGGSFAGMTSKVASGSNALTQMGRIVQDLPFGVNGFGNNVTASAEAVGHLINSTGSLKGAMTAIAGSMLGAGGVMLAISAITTGLTIMSREGLTVGDVLMKLTGSFDTAKKAMMDINAEAAKNASAQTASVGAYVSAAKNINLSMSDRLIAVRKLQDEYPGYFGNLTKEQILNGDVAGSVREVAKALIAKSRAAALSGKLADLAEKEFLLREKETAAIKAQNAAQKSLNNSQQAFSGGGVIGAGGQSEAGRLSAAKSTLQDIQDELRSILSTQNLYTKEIEKSVSASIKLETSTSKNAKALKQERNIIVNPQITLQKGTDEQNDKLLAMFRDQLSVDLNKLKTVPIPLNIPLQPVLNTLETSGIIQKLSELDVAANNIIEGSIAETFGRLGDVIGEALATGGNVLKAAGSALIAGIGGLLSDMGSLLIKMGTAAVLAGTVTKLFGTITGVGAGLAAIAGGLVLKGIGSGLSNKASAKGSGDNSVQGGNSVSSPQSSTSTSGGGGFSGGTVVFEISGQSLIGVLSNTLDKNRRLGGALAIG